MGAMTLDTIMIKIESDATGATSGVDKLATSLLNLRNATKGGFNNLQKLGTALQSLNKASSKLSETTAQLDKLSSITTALNQLSSIEKPTGLKHAVDNLSKLPGVMNKITPKNLENITRVSNELAQALTPLANKLAEISQGYSAVSALADKYGVSVTKVREYTKQAHGRFKALSNAMGAVRKAFRSVGDSSKSFGKAAIKSLGSVHSKIKQVGLSLLGTRTLFTAVRKAVSEYMSMDQELSDSISNAWRALGAQLAPAIEYIIHLFTQFIRVIYSIVKALTGIDLIARANAKAMASWGKSSKDTLGQLQKFDDLNVVEFDDGKGDNKLIDMEEIDLSPIQKILDLVRKIKEEMQNAFDTGQWKGVGIAIADLLNYGFNKIKTSDIKKVIKKFAKPVTDTLNGIIENLNWSDFGAAMSNLYTSVVYTATELLKNINFKDLGSGLVDMVMGFDISSVLHSWYEFFQSAHGAFNSMVLSLNDRWDEIKNEAKEVGIELSNIFNEIINGISWADATLSFTEGLNSILTILSTTIKNIDWGSLGKNIGDTINTFFTNFDFMQLVDSVNNIIHGLFTTLTTAIRTTDWGKIGETIVDIIFNINWGQFAIDLADFIDAGIEAAVDAFLGIGRRIWKYIKEGITEDDTRTFGERISHGMAIGMAESATSRNQISRSLKMIGGFIKGFFGIHSPSTWARDEIGKNISLGLANGLNNIWGDSKKHFNNLLSNVVSYLAMSKFKKIGSDMISGIGSGLGTLSSTLGDIFRKAFNGVISIINNMINKINNKLSIKIGSNLSNILKSLGVNISNGTYQLFSIPTIPALSTGTNEVPYEGIYHLHPGEAVVPKKYNPALGNGGSEETNQKLDTLIYLMENMNFTNVVNVGNETLYKKQQAYNKMQNDKYGTTVNI